MNELYSILSNFVTSGLLLACGLLLLFVNVSHIRSANYHKSRKIIAAAYLFLVGMNVAEYFFDHQPGTNIPLLRTVTLAIAVSQALLFTLVFLLLLDFSFPKKWHVPGNLIGAGMLISAIFALYAFCPESCFRVAFYGFIGIYAILMAYYTHLFLKSYRLFRRRMDNYFSGNESERMRWVAFSFFTAFAVGVMALLSSMFTSTLFSLLFTVVFDVFYVWFAFRLINDAHQFQVIEPALESEPTEEPALPEEIEKQVADTASVSFSSAPATLERDIRQWVAGKGFTEKGITVNQLASKLCTNRNYLSTYINTYKNKTFREWINELRIEETKILMRQYPDMTINEIALQMGFTDKSLFIRRFTELTGKSPKEWKMKG